MILKEIVLYQKMALKRLENSLKLIKVAMKTGSPFWTQLVESQRSRRPHNLYELASLANRIQRDANYKSRLILISPLGHESWKLE